MWSKQLTDAFDFAAHLHRNQVRKGGRIAYLSHLMAVAALVLEWGGTEETVVAALLHDAVEDQGGKATLSVIRERFGSRIAELVVACSDNTGFPKPPWEVRKRDFIERLSVSDPEVRLVVGADELHNLRCILYDFRRFGPQIWSRFRGGREGVLWYYDSVLAKLSGSIPQPAEDEIRRTLGELTELISKE